MILLRISTRLILYRYWSSNHLYSFLDELLPTCTLCSMHLKSDIELLLDLLLLIIEFTIDNRLIATRNITRIQEQGHGIQRETKLSRLSRRSVLASYLHQLFVFIIDESVVEYAQTFISPYSHNLGCILKPIWGGQAQSVVDPGQVSQVENVMKL